MMRTSTWVIVTYGLNFRVGDRLNYRVVHITQKNSPHSRLFIQSFRLTAI